jgi:hypothetical protein
MVEKIPDLPTPFSPPSAIRAPRRERGVFPQAEAAKQVANTVTGPLFDRRVILYSQVLAELGPVDHTAEVLQLLQSSSLTSRPLLTSILCVTPPILAKMPAAFPILVLCNASCSNSLALRLISLRSPL